MNPTTRARGPIDPAPPGRPNPSTLMILIATAAFLLELIEPTMLKLLPPLPGAAESLVDALLMTAVLTVLLYLFLMRPMMALIRRRDEAEEELRRVNESLEQQVAHRTTELVDANRRLRRAVDEQEEAAETLRRNNAFVQSVFHNAGCLLLAFDAGRRQCLYVNDRLSDLLGFDQDGFAARPDDVTELLVAVADRGRFRAEVARVTDDPSGPVRWGSFDFLNATRGPIRLAVGLSALEVTPTGHAKTLLLTAMPASD